MTETTPTKTSARKIELTALPAYGRETAKMVLDIIKNYPEQHDQESFDRTTTECGTTRCIAGWIWAIHHPSDDNELGSTSEVNGYDLLQFATKALKLSNIDARSIFFNYDNAGALEMLRRLVKRRDYS